MGDYSFTIEATLSDWPDVDALDFTFDVKVQHICQTTKLLAPAMPDFLVHTETERERTVTLKQFNDTMSLQFGEKDGLSLCGPRKYTIETGLFEQIDLARFFSGEFEMNIQSYSDFVPFILNP